MKYTLALAFLFLGLLVNAQPMTVTVDGEVSFDGANFTISEAGEDFAATLESESSVFVSVNSDDNWDKKNNPNQKWKIEVVKEDLVWNDIVQLEIVRTGQGYGDKNNQISGGSSYQVVNNTSTFFFSGRGLVTDIPVQLRLSGLSVTLGAQDFETNVLLTIYDN
ncbi:hypothetical protein [Maribellus sp. YY47]|uniref:hypothetical protein n=1 Tax=Maribellus sp. YY47 TaxID=2929486 RepID=UPI00200112F4|nr:hypothetical protein [Maribellus sp. YY47]MCK3685529.1 hypothetical protein [Maribellus sp. YY47]